METIRYIHEWISENNELVFHTYPMFHVGSKNYYDKIQDSINQLNHVLIEGVPIKGYKEIGSYARIAKKIGLVSQLESIKFEDGIVVHNIDMPGEKFENELAKLPLRDKIKLRLMDIILLFMSDKQKENILELMKNAFSYPKNMEIELINPEKHYAFKHKQKSKYELLIENQRNEAISTNLCNFIKQNSKRDYRIDIGILFGDEHMPYIYESLKRNGYKWRLESKVVVF